MNLFAIYNENQYVIINRILRKVFALPISYNSMLINDSLMLSNSKSITVENEHKYDNVYVDPFRIFMSLLLPIYLL